MFDYQAGEKYRLTLIFVGIAGLMAGIFISILFMPEPQPVRLKAPPAYAYDPDITGRVAPSTTSRAGTAQASVAQSSTSTDPQLAQSLIEQWLPLVWDLSAATAKQSQEQAIAYMTPECARAYCSNIWTPQLAKQIEESGVVSTFTPSRVLAGSPQADGSVVVYVEGTQTLSAEGKGGSSRAVKLEYLVQQTPNGLRVAGISEDKSTS